MQSYRTNPETSLALSTFIKLMRCTTQVSSDIHRHLKADLSISQFGILEALYHLGPLSQKELAAKILKTAGNLTTVIKNLQKNKLITRTINPEDRRYCIIDLTNEGRQLISAIFPCHAETIRKRISVLSRDEQLQLGGLLKKLALNDPEETYIK